MLFRDKFEYNGEGAGSKGLEKKVVVIRRSNSQKRKELEKYISKVRNYYNKKIYEHNKTNCLSDYDLNGRVYK